MVESLKGGRAMDFDDTDAFPLAALGAVVGTTDIVGGYAVLGRCEGLFEGEG